MRQPKATKGKQPPEIKHEIFVLREERREVPHQRHDGGKNRYGPCVAPDDWRKDFPGERDCVHNAHVGMLGHFVNR